MTRIPLFLLGIVFATASACGDDKPTPGADTVGDTSILDDASGDTTLSDGVLPDTVLPDGVTPDATNPDTVGPDVVEPPLEACPVALPAVSGSDLCDVTGSGNSLLIRGNVILPEGILEGGSVLVVDGYIRCTGCDCADDPAAAGATVVTCPDGVVSPGLINAHDHITFSQMAPQAHGAIRWDHRNEWRTGANGKPTIDRTQNPHALGDAWGEFRQVLAGTTSLFGSGGEAGFLRNLDKGNLLEGISHPSATYATFPVHSGSSGMIVADGCGSYDLPATSVLNAAAYAPHVAEGVLAGARNEFACLSGVEAGSVDVIADNTAFIHGIGVTAADIALFTGEGATLIWSPRTNVDLYGFTAEAQMYHRFGGRVALGTDWTASGSVNMLRELKCAEEWNGRWGNHFTDRELVMMATSWAASALGFGDVLGALAQGKVADIAIWDGRTNGGYRAILDAGVGDVSLVLRGGAPLNLNGKTWYRRGRPLYGDVNLVTALAERALDLQNYDSNIWGPGKKALPPACEPLDICGSNKLLCAAQELEQIPRDGTKYTTMSLGEFMTTLGGQSYGLFFCGVPPGEPTCIPSRPNEFDGLPGSTDGDGDGIADSADNCPTIFNGIRPMDNGVQPDADGDLVGDSCDPCPLDANTTACTSSFDPDDIDNDGVLNASDNCPSIANEDQADFDEDGIGDLCDACPEESNIGGAPCSATIFDIKTGVVTSGQAVLVKDAVVTAVGGDFYTIQVAGPAVEFGGLYIYTGSAGTKPAVGDKVNVQGTTGAYFEQIQLSNGSFTKNGTTPVPEPLVINPADAAPGGSKATAYEALLVEVKNVTVTNTSPTGQDGETVVNEFLITGNLTVDDGVHLLAPFPTVGESFGAIRGVLRLSRGRNKLLPRSAGDVVRGAPIPAGFSPTNGVVRVGDNNVEVFDFLMTRAVAVDTTVQLVSTNTGAVTVAAATFVVPAGESRVAVRVSGLAVGVSTLTATLGADSVTGTVSVVAAATPSLILDMRAASTSLAPGATAEVTVDLDIPAPAGGTLVTITSDHNGVTIPASVTVTVGTRSATFNVTAPDEATAFTVTGTTGTEFVDLDFTVAVEPSLGAIWCFDESNTAVTSLGTFTTPTFSLEGSGSASYPAGNTIERAPSECGARTTSSAISGSGWPSASTASASATRYFKMGFTNSAGNVTLEFDVNRSDTGPAFVAIWTSSAGFVAQDLAVATAFAAGPMLSVGPFSLPAGTSEIRIYAYNASRTGGTFRVDNVALRFVP